jgi:hypothetical protein
MARMIFRPSPGATATYVRIDTAAGTNTPADVVAVDSAQPIRGAIMRAGSRTGVVQNFYGPDGVTTLYEKQLDYAGNVLSTIATLTGVALEVPGLTSGGSSGTDATARTAAATAQTAANTAQAAAVAAAPYGLSVGEGLVNVPVGLHTHAVPRLRPPTGPSSRSPSPARRSAPSLPSAARRPTRTTR